MCPLRLRERWWRHNPLVSLLTVVLAAAGVHRMRGAHDAHCRAGACSALQAQVEAHVALVHRELQEMVTFLCPIEPALRVPSPWEQQHGSRSLGAHDVNVPSCARLRETGLEAYYGNLNMLLVEAWLGKILRALQHVEAPKAELITLDADGLLGGAIFVQQLRLPTDCTLGSVRHVWAMVAARPACSRAAPVAMMLGSERLRREPS